MFSSQYAIGISAGLLGGAIVSVLFGVPWYLNMGQVLGGVAFLFFGWHLADKEEANA